MNYQNRHEHYRDDEFELAPIGKRAAAFLLDWIVLVLLYLGIIVALDLFGIKLTSIDIKGALEVEIKVTGVAAWGETLLKWILGLLPVIYFMLANYGKGQSPGKKLLRIKVVSLYHHRLGLWHSFERSLGYFASALEFGFGYFQAFWNPNRMALHDKLGETIVIRCKPARRRRRK
jgi:uncharacterized RDD family membrane protein YckC